MFPRFAEGLRATGYRLRPELALAAALALAACGSNPESPDPVAAQVVEPAATPADPPAAETFPLDSAAPARPAAESAPNAAAPDRSPSAASAGAPERPPSAATKPPPSAGAPTPATPGAVEPPLPPEAVQQFDNAIAMVTAGNLAAAEQAFRALSATYPSYSGPLVNLGILQLKAGQLEQAEKTLQSALERKADNAIAYNQLGVVYRKQGRFKEADEAYTRALQIDPNYANAYLNLGVLCDLYLQQPQRALESFERYLSLVSAPDEKVSAWVKELKVRLGNTQRSAEAGS